MAFLGNNYWDKVPKQPATPQPAPQQPSQAYNSALGPKVFGLNVGSGYKAPQPATPQPISQPESQGMLGLNPIKNYTNRLATSLQGTIQDSISAPVKQYTSPIQTNLPQQPAQQATLPQQPATQGLQPVEPLSQAGQIYKQRVTQNLLNPNPLAQSAQAQADTNISRRNYQTQKQTQEMMAQSPFGAGTRQYQRAMLEGQAGANQANLGEQNQVNAYTRQLSDQAMERAQGLEDTEYARALGERGYQDQNASRYSALIQDPKGRQAFNRMVASGISPAVALQNILEEGGTIRPEFRGMSNIEQLKSEAGDWVQATTGLKPGMPGYEEAVVDRMTLMDKVTQQPLTDADEQQQIKDALEKQRKGQQLTDDEIELLMGSGDIKQATLQTVPRGTTNVQTWLKDNPNGLININGEIYTVVKGGSPTTDYEQVGFKRSPRHTDYVEVLTPNKETKYIWDGKIQDSPPKEDDTTALEAFFT